MYLNDFVLVVCGGEQKYMNLPKKQSIYISE